MKTCLCISLLCIASLAHPVNYSYVQWLQTPGDGGLNIGAIYLPIENTTNQCFFYITYTGEVAEIRTAEAVGTFAYPAHRGGIVANAPLSGDMIGIVGGEGTVHRFGNLLPWAGSVMPIAGLGRLGTSNSYTFAAPFTIEAQGTGAMGAGWFSNPEANQLWGENGHGTLDFGHVTDIQWTAPQLGDRQAVTIGVPVAGGTPVHLVDA